MYPIVQIKSIQFTDEEFFNFCQDNESLKIERNEKQQVIIMPPTGFTTGYHNNKIGAKLDRLGMKKKIRGLIADSSTGYKLPDGSSSLARCLLGFLGIVEYCS